MGLKAVRQSLMSVIRTAKDTDGFTVYPDMPALPVLPAVVVLPSNDTTAYYQETAGGVTRWVMNVVIMLPFTELGTSQEVLDDELDPRTAGSIAQTLKKNRTLSGTVMDCSLIEARNYGRAEAGDFAGVPFLGAILRLEVREC